MDEDRNMDEAPEAIKDLRVDVFIKGDGPRHRVTHIPSGVHAESDSVRAAVDAVNAGLDGAA